VEGAALRSRGLALCSALEADNPRSSSLHAAIRLREVDLRGWWDEALAGRPESIERQAEALSIDPALARSVLRLALLPELSACSCVLAALRHDGAWDKGDCPHCGSPPVLAEARGLEGRRILRCGLCAAEWPGDRLRCTSCGEADSRALRSTYVEGEGDRFRLACCDRCGVALKIVSTLGPISPPGLLVTELATIHLDMIASGGECRD
jgi:FdhE protein